MNYLFWNTQKRKVNKILEEMIIELSCDIIGLAEYNDDIKELIKSLSKKGKQLYHIPKIGCNRIDIITKYTPGKIENLYETGYYTIKKIPHDTLGYHLVAYAHLSSKLHMNENEQLEEARHLRIDIEELEQIYSDKTIIIGDFNMNPFERGMISAAGMHSISSKLIAKKRERIVKSRTYSMFYNPMWNLLGDLEEPTGTYFLNNSNYENYFWHIFDQVILRPSLLDNFKTESLRIIQNVNGTSLVNNNGVPNISDHLPIYFEVE